MLCCANHSICWLRTNKEKMKIITKKKKKEKLHVEIEARNFCFENEEEMRTKKEEKTVYSTISVVSLYIILVCLLNFAFFMFSLFLFADCKDKLLFFLSDSHNKIQSSHVMHDYSPKYKANTNQSIYTRE